MLKYVKKYQFYLVYIKTATLIISIKPLLDVFQKPDFSKAAVSELFKRFFGISQVASANGDVSLINQISYLFTKYCIRSGKNKGKLSIPSSTKLGQPNYLVVVHKI
jgi:elongation factor P--beta-lysine ligase